MVLYLGLDPSRFPRKKDLFHYPVIRTEKIFSDELMQALLLFPQFTHVIFTSITAVRYWRQESTLEGKIIVAVGKATAEELRKDGYFPVIAKEEMQEGVIALLKTMDMGESFLFLPRSKKARPLLAKYLQQENRRFFALDLYDTVFQKPEPAPLLENVEEIVFTSPSTVDGFLKIYGSLPKNIKLTSIGPITNEYLEKRNVFCFP